MMRLPSQGHYGDLLRDVPADHVWTGVVPSQIMGFDAEQLV